MYAAGLILCLVAGAASSCVRRGAFSNLVTFGDSYTDNGRLGYYINNQGNAPPPGVLPAASNKTASGGLAWGDFVAKLTGAKYYDYAISGATCSNKIVSRYFGAIKKPFPSVMDDEIPSFKADVGVEALYGNRTAENTVYAMWIGTNDLGYTGFLSDSQAPGTDITSFVECVWQIFDNIYQTGGRRFVLLNEAPLQLAPEYASQAKGGAGDNQYWQNKTLYNETEYEQKILQYTTNVNTMFDYGAPFNLLVKKRWPGASFAIFDVHRLFADIHANPGAYLDAPADATGFFHACVPTNNSNCVDSKNPASSFLWYDELHPSEKADSIIAKHFIDVVAGNSTYGTTYTSKKRG